MGVSDFSLDESDVQRTLETARSRVGEAARVLERAGEGAGLDPTELAVLWFATEVSTDSLYDTARRLRDRSARPLETFSPLYMTNTCDAECRMCGMRRNNDALSRQTASTDEVDTQLALLQQRGMNGVALLTGEYRPESRGWALEYVNRSLRRAEELGFGHVLINVGSIDEHEIEPLLDGLHRDEDGAISAKVTMCTFQETYSRTHYTKFMGDDPANPRADYDRRLTNFDRLRRGGMRVANPGILVGLNGDLAFEMTALALHTRHLQERGMEVYLSVPRLRQIAGGRSQGGVDDETFVRLVSLLAIGLPDAKVVITTRESQDVQRKLVPIVSVLSAGSAAVTPYTPEGARFPLEASQFEVLDQRPFEEVLDDFVPSEGAIVNYRRAS